MATISRSVGVGGINDQQDVLTVLNLLDYVPETDGGPLLSLSPRGVRCIDARNVAIKKFQWRQFQMNARPPDGLIGPRGPTLSRLNGFEPPRRAPRYVAPTNRGTATPLLFAGMWNVIRVNHTRRLNDFPPELLIGLFWEESNFMNIRGRRNSNMLGFGQVNRSLLPVLNSRYGKNFTESGVLGSHSESVELASIALDNAYNESPNKDLERVLHYYATGNSTSRNPVINHWIACMNILKNHAQLSPHIGTISDQKGNYIREALWAARRCPYGTSPDRAFPP